MSWHYFFPGENETAEDAREFVQQSWQHVYTAEDVAVAVAESMLEGSDCTWEGVLIGVISDDEQVTLWEMHGEHIIHWTAYRKD